MFLIVSRLLIPKGYSGLTLFPFIIIRHKGDRDDRVLIHHERIHIRQQAEMLVIPFFLWYGIEFILRWIRYRSIALAYKNISFEREAYANEKDPEYLKTRPFWRFVKFV